VVARSRSIIALLALVAGAVLPAAAASAEPSKPSTLTYMLTCPGPTKFSAVKQPGGAAALRLTDSTSVFIAVEAVDVETGVPLFTTPGFQHNGLTTVTCAVVNPTNGRTQAVTGLLVPVG
jgi:hypothetical protein